MRLDIAVRDLDNQTIEATQEWLRTNREAKIEMTGTTWDRELRATMSDDYFATRGEWIPQLCSVMWRGWTRYIVEGRLVVKKRAYTWTVSNGWYTDSSDLSYTFEIATARSQKVVGDPVDRRLRHYLGVIPTVTRDKLTSRYVFETRGRPLSSMLEALGQIDIHIDELRANIRDESGKLVMTVSRSSAGPNFFRLRLNPDAPLEPPKANPLVLADTRRALAAYRRMKEKQVARYNRYHRFIVRKVTKKYGEPSPYRCMYSRAVLVSEVEHCAGSTVFKAVGCSGCAAKAALDNLHKYFETGQMPHDKPECKLLEKWHIGPPDLQVGELLLPFET